MKVLVLATTAVAGMWAGEEYELELDDFVQLLIDVGHLTLLESNDPDAEVEAPVEGAVDAVVQVVEPDQSEAVIATPVELVEEAQASGE